MNVDVERPSTSTLLERCGRMETWDEHEACALCIFEVRAGLRAREATRAERPPSRPPSSLNAGACRAREAGSTASITGYRSIENVSENLPITSWDKGPFVNQTFHKHFMPCSKHVKGLEIWGCTPYVLPMSSGAASARRQFSLFSTPTSQRL